MCNDEAPSTHLLQELTVALTETQLRYVMSIDYVNSDVSDRMWSRSR